MPKRDFQASKGLVKKVATKQSGVIQKAWLEAVMNSVDAGASLIELRIEEEWTDISDDGDSMTEDEVYKYFEQFGLEDDDVEDKEFGKFRIGRGQIFNFGVNIWRAKQNYMVVSLDDEDVSVNLEDCTAEDDESIIEVNDSIYKVDTEGLGYAMLDAESVDEGLTIHVQHYDPIEDLEETIAEFKNLVRYVSWVHDVEITVNGDKVGDEPKVIEETDNAWFVEADSKYTNHSPVYNKGARVDRFGLGPRRLGIITKNDLDVTLDRTDILDTDEYWQTIQDEYREVIIKEMVDDDDLSTEERNWLLEQASQNAALIQMIQDKPLIEDVEGDLWTIGSIAHKKIGFGRKDDKIAEDANGQAGVTMVVEDQEDSMTEFIEGAQETIANSNLKSYSEIVDEKLAFEMDEIPDEDLSKRRMKNLRMLRNALLDLGFTDRVKAGYSNHKNVWKDENKELFIHKNYLNQSKKEIVTEVFFEVVKVASHKGDTRAGLQEDFSLNRSFYEMVNGEKFSADHNFPEVQRKLMAGDYE